ncbi:Uncharacterised protein [Mycobacterium tuberculosis]|uniref:Uncharacterized protein n=2 Tax=Mycobacterium tuberculosis TaxID=1773 RepID=A0A654U5F2_MYCTX|nr:Uncharacterised protein [Mycobacterium tuberculosis]
MLASARITSVDRGVADGSAIHWIMRPSMTAINTETMVDRFSGGAMSVPASAAPARSTECCRTSAYPAARRSRKASERNAGAYDSTHAYTAGRICSNESTVASSTARICPAGPAARE